MKKSLLLLSLAGAHSAQAFQPVAKKPALEVEVNESIPVMSGIDSTPLPILNLDAVAHSEPSSRDSQLDKSTLSAEETLEKAAQASAKLTKAQEEELRKIDLKIRCNFMPLFFQNFTTPPSSPTPTQAPTRKRLPIDCNEERL